MSWDRPVFESAFERRRLRILNSLFFAVAKMNGRSSLHGREAREIRISFFQQHLHLSLDKPKGSNRRNTLPNTNNGSDETRLCMSILKGLNSEDLVVSWQHRDTETRDAPHGYRGSCDPDGRKLIPRKGFASASMAH